MCSIAASTPSTTRAAMIASRYSVHQSSSVAGCTRASTACAASSPRTSQPASSRSRNERCEMRRRAGAIDQQRLGRAADAGAAQLGVQHDRRAPWRDRRRDRRTRGSCPRGGRSPARAPRSARARPGSCRRAARSRRCSRSCRRACRRPPRDRSSARSWMQASGSPAASSPDTRQAWIAALERMLSEPPRRITALPDFRHSAPASAVTFGRLS